MNESIRPGDWLQFQVIEQGALVTDEGYVTEDPNFPRYQRLWVGRRIVADSDDKQIDTIVVLAHTPTDPGKGIQIFNRATAAAQDLAAAGFGDADSAAKMLSKALNDPVKGMSAHGPDDPIDRIARAIADADDNSRPGCVYVKLAEAAMAAGGAE